MTIEEIKKIISKNGGTISATYSAKGTIKYLLRRKDRKPIADEYFRNLPLALLVKKLRTKTVQKVFTIHEQALMDAFKDYKEPEEGAEEGAEPPQAKDPTPEAQKAETGAGGDTTATPSHLKEEVAELLAKEKETLSEYESELADMVSERFALWEKKRKLDYGPEKTEVENRISELHPKIQAAEDGINPQKNVVKALGNGGAIMDYTDATGVLHPRIPDFRGISTEFISFSEKDILDVEAPKYIPYIDEDRFTRKGFVFDAIRIDKNSYLFAINGYREPNKERYISGYIPSTYYCVASLDQLVLIVDWYSKKAKANAIKTVDEINQMREERFDNLSRKRKEDSYNYRDFYEGMLPSKIKKKYSKEEWESLTLEQKIEVYKPFTRKSHKRLNVKLKVDEMWVSFHYMFNRFVDPEAKQPAPKRGHPKAFAYWYEFRDRMNFKINDIQIQRQDLSDTYQKGMETSYGDSGTSEALFEKYGILVKRQNGENINPVDIGQIDAAWGEVQNTFGDLKRLAVEYGLKVSHSGRKMMFANKRAIGVFIPSMRSVGVSNKYGDNQFFSTMAHEVAHFIDYSIGKSKGLRYATDDFEGTAGKAAFAFRSGMNLSSSKQTAYINATKECFARALQQYFAYKKHGYDALIDYSEGKLENAERIFSSANYVPKSVWESKVLPLIQQFFNENKDVLTPVVNADEMEKPEIETEPKPPTETASEERPAQTEPEALESAAKTEASSLKELVNKFVLLNDGGLSWHEYLEFKKWYKDNEKNTIRPWLEALTVSQLKNYTIFYSGERKSDLINKILGNFYGQFTLGKGVSYSPFEEKYEDARQRVLDSIDEPYYVQYFQEQAEQKAKEQKELENPETIIEFRRAKELRELSSEEWATFDALLAEEYFDELEERARKKREAARPAKALSDSVSFNYHEATHTKKGHDIFVAELAVRVEADVFKSLKSSARGFGGYYSSYRGGGAIPGFVFLDAESAKNFIAENTAAEEKEEGPEERQEEEVAPKKPNAESLRQKGLSLMIKAQEIIDQPRLTNTHRRASMAAGVEARAEYDRKTGRVLMDIAARIEAGTAKFVHLIKNKTEVEQIRRHLRNALYKYAKENSIEEEAIEGFPDEAFMFVKKDFPRLYIDEHNFLRLDEDLKNAPRKKRDAKKLLKYIYSFMRDVRAKGKDGDVMVFSHPSDIALLVDVFTDKSIIPSNFLRYDRVIDTIKDHERLLRIGAKNTPIFRAILREMADIIGYAPPTQEEINERKIKEIEQGVRFSKIAGFFPTPEKLAKEVVEMADIQEGHKVLEPSAGIGSLALAVLEVQPEAALTVLEYDSKLNALLELKGFDVRGYDMFDHAGQYDRIVMNPPFEKNQDIDHVMYAYENLLAPGGVLVAIMSSSAYDHNSGIKKRKEFTEFLDENGEAGEIKEKEFSGTDSFRQTGVNVRVVRLWKPEETPAPKPPTEPDADSLEDIINGLEAALPFLEGNEGNSLKEIIDGLKVAAEFI